MFVPLLPTSPNTGQFVEYKTRVYDDGLQEKRVLQFLSNYFIIMANPSYIGIDIAKSTFVSAQLTEKGKYATKTWAYETPEDIAAFIATLQPSDHCVVEATGTYSSRLVYALISQEFAVSVVNPLSIKRYGQMKSITTKTDKADAILIAKYAVSEQPEKYILPKESSEQLTQRRMILRHLQGERLRYQNQLESINHQARPDKFSKGFLEQSIVHIDTQITVVKDEVKKIIDEDYTDMFNNLKTIPGVGDVVATAIIDAVSTFDGLDDENAVKKFAKFAGLAPTIHTSGTSVRGKSHIGRTGAPDLRQKMYLPAVGISTRGKNDNIFKSFYRALTQRGKSAKEAIVAVMHKILRIAIAVIKSNQPFDLEKYAKAV